MKLIPGSIKWRIQLWHGVILLLVLAGFGATAYELQRTRELRRVDDELQARMVALVPALRPFRPGGPRLRDRFFRPAEPPPGNRPLDSTGTNSPPVPPGPPVFPEGQRPPDGPRDRPEGGPLQLPPFPTPEQAGPFYYAAWARDGRLVRALGAPDDLPAPQGAGPGQFRSRGEFRELVRITPRGDAVLVGRSMAPEMAEFRQLSLLFLGAGLAVLGLGLAGGWLVTSRALRPIDQITGTALKIASGDLSQRIPHAETESELGRLVSILNSTFARLEAAFLEQTRFTTDISHELRTPVTVILSQTQTALSRERTAHDYRQAIEASQRAAQRMRRLIESLLQLARLDAGQESLRRTEFDLAEVARDVAQLIAPLAAERGLSLATELSPARCQGDAEMISQVVTNLLHNAIHYTEKGAVTVATRLEKNHAVLAVSDTGIGISAEDLARIFDRFFRVDASRSHAKGGSGLGLAISRAIVHAHGGTIEASSQPGQGATFTLRLPV